VPYTVPQDYNGREFFGRKTTDGENAFMPTVIYSADGVTPISTVNPLPSAFYAKDGNGNDVQIKANNKGEIITQILGSIVIDSHEGDSDFYESYTPQVTGLSIANDGLEHLTFKIGDGVTKTVYAGEAYTGNFPPFTQLEVFATDNYRLEVLR